MQQSIGQDTKRHDTRAAILQAAERLIAEMGLGAVSVKMITKAAGAQNASAVHYHFGSIEGLIKEVFAKRYRQIEAERLERMKQVAERDSKARLTALIKAAIGPFLEAALEEDGRLYISFCLQFASSPRFDYAQLLSDEGFQSAAPLRLEIASCLSHVPFASLVPRFRHGFMIGLVQAADYARLVENGTAPEIEDAIADSAACLSAYLSAPMS